MHQSTHGYHSPSTPNSFLSFVYASHVGPHSVQKNPWKERTKTISQARSIIRTLVMKSKVNPIEVN